MLWLGFATERASEVVCRVMTDDGVDDVDVELAPHIIAQNGLSESSTPLPRHGCNK